MSTPTPTPVTRLVRPEDAESLRTIYNAEVVDSTVTMDLVPRSLEEQRLWIAQHSGVYPAVVALETFESCDRILGFASVSPYRARPGYNSTVENSVYVDRNHQRRGLGRLLLIDVLKRAADSGFHTCIARIADGHDASIKLHASLGFALVGIEREVARKFNRWIDIAIMQKMLGD